MADSLGWRPSIYPNWTGMNNFTLSEHIWDEGKKSKVVKGKPHHQGTKATLGENDFEKKSMYKYLSEYSSGLSQGKNRK